MQFDSDRYELIKHERIEELKSEGYLFRHKLSGARIAILQNDDENKVFSIIKLSTPFWIFSYVVLPLNAKLALRLFLLTSSISNCGGICNRLWRFCGGL